MRLMSKQSTNQWIQKTCVTIISLACLLTTEGWLLMVVEAKPEPCLARQLDSIKGDGNCDDSIASSYYHKPHFTGNRSVIVQLFEWKFLDIAEECRLFLGPQGYAGVQLSPVLEHTLVKSKSGKFTHPWWERYEVISYRLASRSGDETEFWAMSRICNDHGVRIYVDVVLNNMAAPLHILDGTITNKDFIVDTLLEENINISQLNYPNVSYTQQDFHRPCNIGNTQDAHEIRNCQLNGHPDLDHSKAEVQERIVEMLNKFIDMGVAGFRIDAAKYIWPIDLKKIFEQVDDLNEDFSFAKNTRPFLYQDVFDLGLDSVSKTEYSTYGVVSEYLYPAELATILNGKAPLSSLINWGPAMGFLAHQDSLVFIDSPDTQRRRPIELGRNYMLTHKQRIKYIMANAFMLAHPYGNIKRIMSSYYFQKKAINQGPPVEEEDEHIIRSPQFNEEEQCTVESGWVCEHRWPPLVQMMKVANYFRVTGQREESIIHFQTNGPNQIAFCRGYKLFMAMNNDAELDFIKEVYTCMEPGLYCDVITGGKKDDESGCHGRQLKVNDLGYAQLNLEVADGNDVDVVVMEEEGEEPQKVESYGVLVVYVGSKINQKTEEEIENVDAEVKAQSNEVIEGEEGNEDVNNEEAVEDNNDPSQTNETEEDGGEGEANNEIETSEDPAVAENEDPPPPNSEEGKRNIDEPEAENEIDDETPAEKEAEVIEAAEEDNEIENPEDPVMTENEQSQPNPEEGDEPDAENEADDETPAEDEAKNDLEVVEAVAEDNEIDNPEDPAMAENDAETPAEDEAEDEPKQGAGEENEVNETENQLEENEGDLPNIIFPEVSAEGEETAIENPEEENLPQEEVEAEATPEEYSKEIKSQEDDPENIDEIDENPEEQLEKPSSAIKDDINQPTEHIQAKQKAGFFSKSSKDTKSKA